jgi:hypothetical protein
MSNSGWDMYVFRDGRRTVSGAELIASLASALGRWQMAPERRTEDFALLALIAAGELECALLDDADEPTESIGFAAEITDTLARNLLTGEKDSLSSILQTLARIHVAPSYQVAVQEGFAYYALHPRKLATLLESIPLKPRTAVLGIRSVGVTLSAVAKAALRLRGIECRRITVRPTGHPYDRKLQVTPELREWVEHSGSEFLIVDEGPGISGSSFLAVAEALEECGVQNRRIHLVGSREVDPATLRAENAAVRWPRYYFHPVQSAPLAPPEAGESLSGGVWRRRFRGVHDNVPATWAPLEPAKYFAKNERSIFKFEGFGHYGEEVGERAMLLAARGFSPHYLGNQNGFGRYEFLPGRTLNLGDRSSEMITSMAEYLAWRGTAFASAEPQTPELEKMLCWNWHTEFGEELESDESWLKVARVTLCDARMMPQEWLCTSNGKLLKLDGASHGDNHFFPGPCDIAWDVAGAIVEWEMMGQARERFLSEYEARSGDPVRERLYPYMLAYVVFRLGWCKMATLAMHGEYDETLLERDYHRYRTFATHLRKRALAA